MKKKHALLDKIILSENLKEEFLKHGGELVSAFILILLEQLPLEIGTFVSGTDNGAVISSNIYKDKNVLNLRLESDQTFELIYSYENDETGDLEEASYKLTSHDIKSIPAGLQTLMKKVLLENKPLVFNEGLIDN